MKRVLIIESDEPTSFVLNEILKTENCTVEIASSSAEVKELIKKNRYDIVYADHWTMINENSKEVFIRLNEQGAKIYMLSSLQELQNYFKSIKYERILKKPFNIQDFINCLDS